jgi:hypothetical protein
MKKVILFCMLYAFASQLKAQSLAINTDGSTANSSAMLDIKSTTKGLLIPRMSKVQRNSIAAPANGLMVYVNAPDTLGLCFYDGTAWKWIEEKNNNAWGINGNSGTTPGINYIGTADFTDLSFGIGGTEQMRLSKEVSLGIGIIPKYSLDIKTGGNGINFCNYNGIRVKTINNSSVCDEGLLMGYQNSVSNDAVIWNYGQAAGLKNLIFGVEGLERLRLNGNGLVGISESNPLYTLDIRAINTNIICGNGRRGIRIDGYQGPLFDCDRGLFLGYDNSTSPNSTSIWNFTTSGNDRYLRFGFGLDFSPPIGYGSSEVMRILPQGQGVGIGIAAPLAMVHIQNANAGVAMPGVMVTDLALPAGLPGFYTGLQIATLNDAYVWNYPNAPIHFGTNDLERMRITANGNVGIGEINPGFPLNFASTLGDKISLYGNSSNHYGFGIQGSLLQIHSAGSGDDIAFGYGSSASFTERMRIKGNGAVGIGISNPSYVLEVNGRSLVHSGGSNSTSAGIWFNNNANTVNTGFVGMESDNAIGFYGTGTPNGWGVVMNIATGNVGIGISNPSQKLHVIGNILATGTITPSDIRYKQQIQNITNPIANLQKLNGVTYEFNTAAFPEWQFDNNLQYGLIAQEVEKVFPEMVKIIDTKKGYKGVDYVKLIPVLIEAVKEQQKQIDKQNNKISNQQQQIDTLIKKLN